MICDGGLTCNVTLTKALNDCISTTRCFHHRESSGLHVIAGPACIMPWFYSLLFIVLLKECPATSLTHLPPSKSISSFDSTLPSNLTSQASSLGREGWDCDPHDLAPNLNFPNCLLATMALPSSAQIGQFHRGAMWNIYSLPSTSVSEDCGILVDFANGVREEEGRWSDVLLKTLEIIHACVGREGVGGNGLVGEHERIRVSVRYRYQGAGGDDSLTIPYVLRNYTDA